MISYADISKNTYISAVSHVESIYDPFSPIPGSGSSRFGLNRSRQKAERRYSMVVISITFSSLR